MSVEEDVSTMTDQTEDTTGSSDSRRWQIACAGLAVLLVAAAVACFLLWQDRSDHEDRLAAEKAATAEAERIVVSWLTYDYRTYDDDMAWVTESGTDAFQEEYSPEALEGLRQEMVGPRQLVSRGRVVNSAATVEDDHHVTVLVFTDQTLTDRKIRRQGGEALHARSGVELVMVRDGDEWLVDEMVQLQFQ
ncbi:hypothetical protein [Nocardioides antri]|uniref:Mce-associated membrane protein n=1 Tax=Nocardioides antri TaxID=2607659 RepID=A0A5B1M3I2_9ACTN|nr:hypothetical protein [Nocardioides antri]KAA1426978.1 hypothetical protein F0U47_11750 [Nocardioides antri]